MRQKGRISYFIITIIFLVFFAAYSPSNCVAAVRARVDRQTISVDETVNLSIEADGALNSIAGLDTSVLEKDFSIVNQSTSSNFQIINGSSKATKIWNIELEPKHVGTLTIPSFTIHGEKTAPLTLTVTNKAPITPGSSAVIGDVFIEVLPVMETPAYLQGQITLSIKLYLKSQLNLSEASLEEPKLEHATVIKLGDDRRYQSRRNGVVYQAIERKYAIFPEEGREVVIPPLLFQAIASAGGNRFFSNDPFFSHFPGRGRRIRMRSQELKIPLTPIPDFFRGKIWLPARNLTIKEDKIQLKKLKVGEPLTRTIQIDAFGLMAEQLPEIKVKAPDGCKIYLDQPELKNEVDGNDYIHAIKRQSMAFIPSREGTFTLPEISIDWWDVVNNRQRRSILPACQINVVATPGQQQQLVVGNQDNNPPTVKTHSADGAKKQAVRAKKAPSEKTVIPDSVRLWQSVSLILLLLWLITFYCWCQALRVRVINQQKRVEQEEKKSMANRERIKKACLANDPSMVQQAILDWAAATWSQNPPTNLKNLAATIGNDELNRVFAKLDEVLYSPEAKREWDGSKFWQVIAKNLQKKSSTKPAGKGGKTLPPLYSD
jgi:cell division protein FtsB